MPIDQEGILNRLEEVLRALKYRLQIEEVAEAWPLRSSIYIDFEDLDREARVLAEPFMGITANLTPDQILAVADEAIKSIIPPDLGPKPITMRVVNLPPENHLGVQIVSEHSVMHFITICGQVIEIGKPHLAFSEFHYQCLRCDYITIIEQENPFKEDSPYECIGCNKPANQTSFKLIESESKGEVRRFITVQENLEEASHGGEPGTIDVVLSGVDLVNAFSLGGRYKFNGILRQTKDMDRDRYRIFYLDCNSIELVDEVKDLESTEEERDEFRKMAKKENVLNALASKMATSIFGNTMEKKVILLQILGGVPGRSRSDGSTIRGDIHVLFVGDPGTAKSQLLRYAARIAPRSVFVSGPRSTKAGLIGTYIEGRNGARVYRAGALPKADGGFCVIDEFEKMSVQDSQGIHEALEQQHTTISMAYGRIDVLTRCPILAAANPENQRFHDESPVFDQIDLEPAMLSRFDLVIPFVDHVNKERDRDIANHILREHQGAIRDREEDEGFGNLSYLRKFVVMAKEFKPVLTDEAIHHISEFYTKKRAESTKFRLTLTPRNAEGLERLAYAAAKSRFSSKVELQDAEVATEIVEYFLRMVHNDIGIVIGGSKRQMVKAGKLALFRSVMLSFPEGFTENDLREKAKAFGLSVDEARILLDRAIDRGECYYQTSDRIVPVVRGGGDIA